jgi:transposase-like protein
MAPFIPKLHTPYKDLLPPLTEEEEMALEADIRTNGQLSPVLIDEANNILDGHHRYQICCRIPITVQTKVIPGLRNDWEKRRIVYKSNFNRRNLDQAAKQEARQQQIEVYRNLRQFDPKTWTLQNIAMECGVHETTVGKWFSNETWLLPKQDARRKLTVEQEKQIAESLESGDSTSHVAKKHGVSKGRVSQIKKQAKKRPVEGRDDLSKKERERLIAAGRDHLLQSVDCFVPVEDEVATAAIKEILGEWFDF